MLDGLLTEIASFARPQGEVWFRGQSDASWPLLPRLLRSANGTLYERNLLARFRARAMSILQNPPPDNDPARWIFLMQHHGLPTRLLDWTESALAALFFAVCDHDDRDGCLYIMLPLELNQNQVGERSLFMPYSDRMHQLLLACFKGNPASTNTLALLAYSSNDRLARQQGSFTIHGDATDFRERSDAKWFRAVQIPAIEKPVIRQQLSYLGVSRTSLFNDLDSLARDLREQHGIA
jgi:hypothetical protein